MRTRPGRLAVPLLACALALVASACRGGGARPISTVDSYAAALEARDYGRAYDLMSDRYKQTHPRDEFIRRMRESAGEVKETAGRLRTGSREVEVSARVPYGELGDELVLVQEQDTWRISGDPLAFYPQDTPRHALRSFLRAVDLGRWDVVLRFVPLEYREKMTPEQVKQEFQGARRDENTAMLKLLAAHLERPIEVQGDVARMPFGDQYEVKFKREDGVWKIIEPW